MRKKFTMLLASLFLVMGSAWAKTVTVVNTERWYQFCCTSKDAVHGNGANVWLADDGTAFAGKSNTPTFFKFISASEGKYYLYSLASERYVNVVDGKVVPGETASTEWTIGTINEEGYVYISNSDKNYLNNAGGTNNIQIKNHPAGVQSGNPCSLWYMHEFNAVAVINVTYKLGDKKATTSEYKSKGETYNVNNPYGFTSVVSCTDNGEALAANDGVYSFEITGDANVVVEIQENLPFKTTTITDGNFAAGTEWYAITQKDNAGYWQYQNGQDPNVKHITANDIYDETQMWCFTGNSLDGFKIYNKKAGATYSLKTDQTVKLVENNNTVWDVKPSTKAFTESDKRLGFSRPGKSGNDEFINRRDNGTLQNWSLDNGSTSRLVSITEKYAEIAANWEKMIMAGAVGSIIGEKAQQVRALIDAYVAVPSQENEDAVNNFIATVTAAEDRLQLTEGSYYMVVSADGRFLANQSVEKAIYSDGADLRWGTRDNLNRAQIWRAIKVDGKWRFQNFKDMLVMVASKTDADDVFVKRQDDVTSDYTADIKLENIQNTFTQWNVKFESAPDASMHAFGHDSGNGGTSNIILHGGGNASDPSAWRIIEVAQEGLVAAAKAELNPLMTTLYNGYYDAWAGTDYKWRDQPGVNNYTLDPFYSYVGNLEACYNTAKAVYDNEQSTADDVETQISILSAVLSEGLIINLPEAGKFYRLRCVAGQKYVSADISSSRFEMQPSSSKDPDHMFLYDGEALLSYSQGLYMNHHNFNAVSAKSTVAFAEAANGAKGQYNIKIGDRYIYGEGDTQSNHMDSGTGSPTNANEQGYNWWLEEVTTLPVTVGTRLHATFFAPVAVTIPEGIQAYTGEVNGEWLTLTEVVGTIPARTPVVLIAQEAKTYEFAIVESEATAVVSHLRGTTPTIVNDKKDAADKYYTLQSHGDNGVAFRPYTGANFGGFKAYLEIPAGTNAAALRIRFAGEEDATGIEGIELGEELVIYDLAGRRVQKMEKGIYIVNGRKVIK